MKVAVINYSGNTGKTTVSRNLLSPRMNGATLIAIETINAGVDDLDPIAAKEYGNLIEAMRIMDDVIVDVGTSNVEMFMNLMKQYKGSHSEFDYFVVPTINGTKEIEDTISTIRILSEEGVPKDKIRLVFNIVEPNENIQNTFMGIFDFHRDENKFILNENAFLVKHDFYTLKIDNKNIEDLVADTTDYRKLISETPDKSEKLKFSRMISAKQLAINLKAEMDRVFKELF